MTRDVTQNEKSNGSAAIIHGDCLAALRQLDDASVDAVCCDPPAGLTGDDLLVGSSNCISWLTAKVSFPQLHDANAVQFETFDLFTVSGDSANLQGTQGRVESGIGVPESAVELQDNPSRREPEISHAGYASGGAISEQMLLNKLLCGYLAENVSSFVLGFRSTDASFHPCDLACGCFRQLGPRLVTFPVVVPLPPSARSFDTASFPSLSGFVGNAVRLGQNALHQTETSTSVVTSATTEIVAVLCLDLGTRTAQLLPANGASHGHLPTLFLTPKAVGARSGAGSLTSVSKANRVGEIRDTANRTNSGFHVQVPFDVVRVLQRRVAQRGFMGKPWDATGTWLTVDLWKEVYRVLKPGGHAVVWALPRTSHHTAMGLERAGFDIRDNGTYLFHVFGSGFPKSLDVSKAIDKAAGAERTTVVGKGKAGAAFHYGNPGDGGFGNTAAKDGGVASTSWDVTAPATDAAKAWEGWGTALKPAVEFWIVARKPLDGTVAENVLAHGTGALNIDGCRIATKADDDIFEKNPHTQGGFGHANASVYGDSAGAPTYDPAKGRWPAHLILDEGAAALLDEQSGVSKSTGGRTVKRSGGGNVGSGKKSEKWVTNDDPGYGDVGGASRFFYVPKASRKDKGEGNTHPTVKSTELMAWLVRLVTPPGGLVLDPFMGSGSTGVAALREGFHFLGIEREAEYVAIARRRLAAELGVDPDLVELP